MTRKSQSADIALVRTKLWTAIAAFPLVVGLNAGCEDEPSDVSMDCEASKKTFEVPYNPSNYCGHSRTEWRFPRGEAFANTKVLVVSEYYTRLPEEFLDCPSFVVSQNSNGYEYSMDIDRRVTQNLRDEGNTCLCVYSSEDICMVGRSLTDGDQHIVAHVQEGSQWGGEDLNGEQSLLAEIQTLPDAVREEIGQEWLRDALFEHASVASFARAGLELMRHGAPPELLKATLNAGLDEVKHATLCFALASAYARKPLEAGPIPDMPPVRAQSLVQLAVDVFLEGAVEESTAVLVAVRAASRCEIPAAKEALSQIIDDETNHAALAWATLAWAIQQGGDPVRDALLAAVQTADAHLTAAHDCEVLHAATSAWRRHGRLSHDEQRRARLDAWNGVIKPSLARILEVSRACADEVAAAGPA